MSELKTAWDFVEKYYPNYSSSDDIAENNDLAKIMDNECQRDDCAYKILHDRYKGDLKHPDIEIDYLDSLQGIYVRAIEGYLKTLEPVVDTFLEWRLRTCYGCDAFVQDKFGCNIFENPVMNVTEEDCMDSICPKHCEGCNVQSGEPLGCELGPEELTFLLEKYNREKDAFSIFKTV